MVGFFNKSDFICQVIAALASLSIPPPLSSLSRSATLSLLCVDDAAAHMVMLSHWFEEKLLSERDSAPRVQKSCQSCQICRLCDSCHSCQSCQNIFVHAGRFGICWGDVLEGLAESPFVKWSDCRSQEKTEEIREVINKKEEIIEEKREIREKREWIEGMFQSCPLLKFHLEKFKFQSCGEVTPINLDRDLESILSLILPERNPMMCQQTDDILKKCLMRKGIGEQEVGEEVGISLCHPITKEMIVRILLPVMARDGFFN